jgi:hypothetical protein
MLLRGLMVVRGLMLLRGLMLVRGLVVVTRRGLNVVILTLKKNIGDGRQRAKEPKTKH